MFTTWMQNVNVNQYKTECKQHLPTYAKNNNKGKAIKFYWTLVFYFRGQKTKCAVFNSYNIYYCDCVNAVSCKSLHCTKTEWNYPVADLGVFEKFWKSLAEK